MGSKSEGTPGVPQAPWGDAPILEMGGHLPLRLAAGDVWQVAAGTVQIFACQTNGMRHPLAAIPAGDLLLGTPETQGLHLLAVGSRDCRLLNVGRERLKRLAEDPAQASSLASLLEGWILRLVAEAPRAVPPKVFQGLQAGEEAQIRAERGAVRPRAGVLWVRCSGETFLFGQDALVLAEGSLLPIPEAAWLTGAEGTRVTPGTTAESVAGGEPWEEGLARFHELFLAHACLWIERSQREERDRLERKAGLDRLSMGSAYARLASVGSDAPHREVDLEEAEEPLLAACRVAGEALGIWFRPPVELTGGVRPKDRLAAICSASQVRHRRVILRGDWWRRDNGPLVAFRFLDMERKKRRAVALIPSSSRSYDLVDPVEGTRTRVDAAAAEELSGDGYMFYPPLPARALTRMDLLRAVLRDRRSDLATIALMGVAGGLLGLVIPIVTGWIFGHVIPGANRGQLMTLVLALVLGALATSVFQITRSVAVLRLGGKMDGAVQAAVWDRLLGLPADFFRRFPVGDLLGRSMGVDAMRELLTGNVVTSILAALFSLFSFGLLFYYSWRLALGMAALVAVLFAVTATLVWLQVRHQRRLLHLQGKVASLLFSLLGGLSKLRVGGAIPRAFSLWAQRFSEQRQTAIRAQRMAIVQTTVNASYGVLTSIALFAMIGFWTEAALPVGDFLAFSTAFGQFLGAALSMLGVLSSVLTLIPLYERLQPILVEVPETDGSKADAGDLSGEIEFSHVSFRYPGDGPLILDDVSFRAGPGEFIALVGPSGAGKSTCMRLILGFERATSGSVYFDGQDLTSLNPQSVRRQLGVVLQSGRPMVGDLFTAIVGNSNLSLEDAWEAARMAGLEEDIKAMPMGMHTVISEGGETFSGGQKQRLLIARAVVHRPRIILFDEATSALDNRTQEIVSRSLEQLKTTRIVIAHRLSTIVNADRIYVLQGGRVVESGTYEELMASGGVFTRLAARQIS